jgi:hypothetical protein
VDAPAVHEITTLLIELIEGPIDTADGASPTVAVMKLDVVALAPDDNAEHGGDVELDKGILEVNLTASIYVVASPEWEQQSYNETKEKSNIVTYRSNKKR